METQGAQNSGVARAGTKHEALGPGVVGCLATALVFYGLSRPHALFGVVQYDDGVYFDAAVRLVSGQVPYRDFTFVQPPGITLLFSPLALLARHIGTRDGLAIARCVTALVAGANAYLAGRLIRHRGAVAATAAAAIVALFPAAVFADRTLMLEPYVVVFCLLGARSCFEDGRLAQRRKLAIGGMYFGIATVTKSWAILVVAAVLIVIISDFSDQTNSLALRVKNGAALIGSAAITVGVICAPFIFAAPESFLHDVVSAQLNRQSGSDAPLWVRLGDIVGINGSNAAPTPFLTYLVTAIILAILVAGGVIPIIRKVTPAVERFVVLAALISTTALLVPSEYFNHYPYFVAPFLAGALVCALARVVQVLQPKIRFNFSASIRRGLVVASLGALVVGSCCLAVGEVRYDNTLLQTTGDPSLAIDLAIPQGSCAVSDAVILLVEANRTSEGSANCPPLVDATGIWLATAPKQQPLGCAAIDPSLVSEWQSMLAQADFFVESGSAQSRVPWTVGLKAWFNANFRHIPDPGAQVFVRLNTPYAAGALDPSRWTPARLSSEGWHPPHHNRSAHRVKLPACLSSRI